jgi:ubiquinone/menaquinone biosynthesis C-methylase UbiE
MSGASGAETYEQFFGPAKFQPMSTIVLEHAAIKEGERVLDLACGTGIVTVQVPPLVGANGKVVGVDLMPGMLEVARAKPAPEGCAIDWREGNACELVDLENAAFEVVTCQQGMQFFSDRVAGASEMRRVLAHGGRAVVAVWQSLEHQGLFQQVAEVQARHFDWPIEKTSMAFSFGDAGALKTTLEDAGFASVEIVEHEIVATFPEPAQFIDRMMRAMAAVMPHFATPEVIEASEIFTKVLAPVIAHYTKDDKVVVPMKTNIAIAKR